MKDGTTHLAYKAENVVDVESDLIVAAEIRKATESDPATLAESVLAAQANLRASPVWPFVRQLIKKYSVGMVTLVIETTDKIESDRKVDHVIPNFPNAQVTSIPSLSIELRDDSDPSERSPRSQSWRLVQHLLMI